MKLFSKLSVAFFLIGILFFGWHVYTYSTAYKTGFWTWIIEYRYNKIIKEAEEINDQNFGENSEKIIESISALQNKYLNLLDFYRKKSPYLLELSPVTEKVIIYDIGITHAYIAQEHKKLNNPKNYDNQMGKAIENISIYANKKITEKQILKILDNIKRNHSSKSDL